MSNEIKLKSTISLGKPTVNGWIITKEAWEEAIANTKFPLLCELNPDYKNMKINLMNVSHAVTGLSVDEDGTVWVHVKVLDTPSGNILRNIINADIKIATNIAFLGVLDDNKHMHDAKISTVSIGAKDVSN